MASRSYEIGDFNGDGTGDVLETSGIVWLTSGSELIENGIWLPPFDSVIAGDFNGDGKADVFSTSVSLSTGESFQLAPDWTLPAGGTPWVVGDFNGDGIDDMLRVAWGVTGADVYLSTGTGFLSVGGWTGYGPGSQGWYAGDFDGDGRTDLLRTEYGLSGAEVLLSTGTSFAPGTVWTTQGNLGSWIVADLDGDGRDDLIDSAGNVLLSDGSAFVASGGLNLGQGAEIIGLSGYSETGEPRLLVELEEDLQVREINLLDLTAPAVFAIEGLPRTAYVGKDVILSVSGLQEGQEARFIISGEASEWSPSGTYVFSPSAEGNYGIAVEVRDAADGSLLAEHHGGRLVSVFNEGKGESAGDITRLAVAEVQSSVSAHAAEEEWRASVHSFADLYAYVSGLCAEQQPDAGPLEKALFMLQFVSGMWAYGNSQNPDDPGEVTDNEIAGETPAADVDADLFINSPIANCEDFAAVLAVLLTLGGYESRIVINPSHVFNEVLVEDQWWTLDATFGIAIDDEFGAALRQDSTPSLLVFSQPSRADGELFRERATEGLHEHLSLIEHGRFPGATRVDITHLFNSFAYGEVFTSELDLSDWNPIPAQSIVEDPAGLELTELLAMTSLRRLKIVEQTSDISDAAARPEWRDGLQSFSDLATFLSGNLPAGGSETDRALFYMQWVSGIWGYGGDLPAGTASEALSSGSASAQDRASLLAWLLEDLGFENELVLEADAAFNQVLLDGQWWTLDPTSGIAIRSDWATAVSTASDPEVYVFPVAGRQYGSPHYSATLAALVHETLTRVANGSFAGSYVATGEWLLDNAFGRSILFEGMFDAGDVNEDDPLKVIDLLAGAEDLSGNELSVTNGSVTLASSNPARSVLFTVSGNSLSIDPAQFGDLDDGDSETLTVSYTITDGDGVATANTAVLVVRGADDEPTIGALDAGDVNEDDPLKVIDLLAGAEDLDGDELSVTDGSVTLASSNAARTVLFTVSGNSLSIDPAQFGDLDDGDSETLTVSYTITDGDGVATANTAVLVVRGADDEPLFKSPEAWSDLNTTGWYVGDFDGDGRHDVFQYVQGVSGAKMLLSSGQEFTDDASWTSYWNGGFGWHVGDFNGDGRDDIFRYLVGSSGADMLLSTGTSFESDGSWTPAGQGSAGWHIGDFNGDGRDDIFRYITGSSGADMFLSTGDSFARAGSWTGAGHGGAGWVVGDFNGDGRDDIFRYVSGKSSADMFLSDGTKFVYDGSWLPDGGMSDKWTVADVNGDGRDDILRRVNDEIEVLLSDGQRFASAGSFQLENGVLRAGDFNGDGADDLLNYLSEGSRSEVLLSDWVL